ncbi:hypothetical protein C8R46DRAFT_1098129, partial [Mycena filopes]
MSSVFASIAGKTGFSRCIVENSRIASFITFHRHDTFTIESPSKTVYTGTRATEPIYDGTLSLPVVLACILALSGCLVSVLATRGIKTQSFVRSQGDRRDSSDEEEPPEPGEDASDEGNPGLADAPGFDYVAGGGEEPSPSPTSGAVVQPRRGGWGWLFWIIMVLTGLVYYYGREFTAYIWRKAVSFFTWFLTPEQRRRIYSAIAAAVNRGLSSFANPVVLSVLSGLVVDYLCGETPLWIPGSIAFLTASSAMSAFYAFAGITRLALIGPPAVYKTLARGSDETHRFGALRWMLWPVAGVVLAGLGYNQRALIPKIHSAMQPFTKLVSSALQDEFPVVRNLVRLSSSRNTNLAPPTQSIPAAPVAVSHSPSV